MWPIELAATPYFCLKTILHKICSKEDTSTEIDREGNSRKGKERKKEWKNEWMQEGGKEGRNEERRLVGESDKQKQEM